MAATKATKKPTQAPKATGPIRSDMISHIVVLGIGVMLGIFAYQSLIGAVREPVNGALLNGAIAMFAAGMLCGAAVSWIKYLHYYNNK